MWESVAHETLIIVSVYFWKVVGALIIVAVGLWLTKLIRRIIVRTLTMRGLEPTVIYFTDSCALVLLYALVLIAALHKLGVETNSLVAMLGAAGLAIGLSLRAQLSNVASGLLIIIFRPFSVGDHIEGGGAEGTVQKIELMSTELLTPENVIVIMPNSKLTADKVVSYAHRNTRKVTMVVGVSFKADLRKIKETLRSIVAGEGFVLKEPEPTIVLQELGDKSAKIEVTAWVRSDDYLKARDVLNEKIKERYDSEEFPLP